MPGQRATENFDFVSPRAVYRAELTSVDTDITSAGIPILDTRDGPNGNVGLGQASRSGYGRNAQIDISLIMEGVTNITVELWMLADVERRELSSADPATTPTLPATTEWVFVDTKTISRSTLWIVQNVPPAQYKIYYKTITSGSGHLNIRENHAS